MTHPPIATSNMNRMPRTFATSHIVTTGKVIETQLPSYGALNLKIESRRMLIVAWVLASNPGNENHPDSPKYKLELHTHALPLRDQPLTVRPHLLMAMSGDWALFGDPYCHLRTDTPIMGENFSTEFSLNECFRRMKAIETKLIQNAIQVESAITTPDLHYTQAETLAQHLRIT